MALADRLAVAEQAQRKAASDLDALQAELAAAQRRAERGEAEAALARQLLATLRVTPRERDGGRRRKAGSSAATAQEDQGEGQANGPSEERDDEQGASARPGHAEDGNVSNVSNVSNDGNDGSDDSKD